MRGFRPDNLYSKRTTAQAATCAIGSGANGVVTITADTAGSAGNLLNVTGVVASGANQALAAAINGNDLTVTLGTDAGSLADATKNTATLVAAAIDGVTGVSAEASGSGATAFAAGFSQTFFTGGHDILSVHDLARQVGMAEVRIQALERGGNCEIEEAQTLADALSVTLASLGSAL